MMDIMSEAPPVVTTSSAVCFDTLVVTVTNCDNTQLASIDPSFSTISNGRKKKLEKKARKGEISTIENYLECVQLGIQGNPEIAITLDKTRDDAKHDLRVQELRGLLLSVFNASLQPRQFQLKNKPFVRRVIILHVSECVNMSDLFPAADDKAYKVKLSQSHNDLVSMPLKLLSIGIEEVPETGASASSEEGASSGSLEDYVINSATMQMWGYPLPLVGTNRENTFAKDDQSPIASTVVDIDDSTEPLVKRIRTESVVVTSSIEVITTTADASTVSCVSSNTEAIEGVTVGVVPTIADTVAITASVPLVGATVKVRNGVQLEGFIETLPTSSTGFRELFRSAVDVTEAPKVVAVDCEMCDTSEGLELTRLTLMDDCNRVLFDSYVKPDREITNYRTQFSGINSELMAKVTVTHAQAQIAFLRLVAAETILVGHSLDSDLKALKIIHRRCVDTSVLYPHSKGFPYRLKLKSLAEQYLKQKIQRDAGGHSSIEDAKAAMQLAKLKAQNGPDFGVKSPDHMREPLISQVSNSSFKAGFFWLAADNATGSAAVPPTATTTATGTLSGFSTSLAEQSEEQRLLMTCCVGGRYHQHNKPVVVDNSSTDTVQLLSQVSTFYQSPLRATSETLDMSLCYVSITQHALQRSSTAAVFKEQLLTIAGSGTLLLVTAQPTSQQVVALRAQKAACSKPMTMATWTPEQEIRLKESLAVHNFGRVWFFTK